jgi:hypothetical protein
MRWRRSLGSRERSWPRIWPAARRRSADDASLAERRRHAMTLQIVALMKRISQTIPTSISQDDRAGAFTPENVPGPRSEGWTAAPLRAPGTAKLKALAIVPHNLRAPGPSFSDSGIRVSGRSKYRPVRCQSRVRRVVATPLRTRPSLGLASGMTQWE